MMKIIVFISLIAVSSASINFSLLAKNKNVYGCDDPRNYILGTWKNELGSQMKVIQIDPSAGYIYGSYTNAAGDFNYPASMIGSLDINGTSIGWTVAFRTPSVNTHTVTSWVGSYNKTHIDSTWIMKTMVDDPSNEWKSLNTGTNMFVKQN